ncbi:MAG TPA: FAD:protein FMN transferase [Clostridiaceae bacterium]|jgi:thiamine biosynthesis lipoprotein|nr:FAD:protein FMN transferase [Clostridiaceae bacterium]
MQNSISLYKKKVNMVILLLPIFFVSLAACTWTIWDDPVETEEFIMGTTITQRVYGSNAEIAVREVIDRLKTIENKMTVKLPDSELNLLNKMAGKGSVSLSQDTINVLKKAKEFSQLSHGAFDVTLGPVINAWGISTDKQRIPDDQEIRDLLLKVNYNDLIIDEKKQEAELEREGQSVDLGGIAKGYAGDEATEIYKKHGIESAYINLGGNVVVLGNRPDGKPWKIGIQNPRDVNGKYIGIVEVSDKAVITSGDYQRYFEKNGERYHHILDPNTGYPAKSGLISATIITGISINGDALSTAIFVLGLEKGMKLVESLEDVECVFITDDRNIYVTSGLKNNFVFMDESKEFKYVKKR